MAGPSPLVGSTSSALSLSRLDEDVCGRIGTSPLDDSAGESPVLSQNWKRPFVEGTALCEQKPAADQNPQALQRKYAREGDATGGSAIRSISSVTHRRETYGPRSGGNEGQQRRRWR